MNTPIDYSCVVVVDDGCDGGGCGGEDEDVAVDAVVLYWKKSNYLNQSTWLNLDEFRRI